MHDPGMRTTIELDDDIRKELIRIAAERGEKGYSAVINEVLRKALRDETQDERELAARAIESAAGTISDEEAERWLRDIRAGRANWGR